jgi:hypothetical protein
MLGVCGFPVVAACSIDYAYTEADWGQSRWGADAGTEIAA